MSPRQVADRGRQDQVKVLTSAVDMLGVELSQLARYAVARNGRGTTASLPLSGEVGYRLLPTQ